jgi:hypothetical protein
VAGDVYALLLSTVDVIAEPHRVWFASGWPDTAQAAEGNIIYNSSGTMMSEKGALIFYLYAIP